MKQYINGIHIYSCNEGKYLLLDAYLPKFYITRKEVYSFIRRLKNQETLVSDDIGTENELLRHGLLNKRKPRSFNIPEKEKCINLKTLFIIITKKCNFSCKYCHIMKNNQVNIYNDVTKELIKKYIDYFYKNSTSLKKNIVFYGGEPLLNFEAIEYAIRYIKKSNYIEPEYSMFTNGSLVTKEIAAKLLNWNVKVIVSIDGSKEYHDKMRVTSNNKGTFENVIKGYNLLKERGCIVGISCTVGYHNVNNLDNICRYFIDSLNPSNIGFNMLHKLLNKTFEKPSIDLVNRMIIKAYELCRTEGIYCVHAINRLRPIVEQRPRIKDCAAYGKQIVVTPDNTLGTCEVFSTSGKCFNLFDQNQPINDNNIINEWNGRYAVNFKECINCAAITLCGGGCAYDSLLNNGCLYSHDIRVCIQSSMFLNWAIENIFKDSNIFTVLSNELIKEIPVNKLKFLYGNIDVNSEKYPLTNYHSSLNVMI
jgi:radical SAM protein with 4Fe4S-binding SPASM domain